MSDTSTKSPKPILIVIDMLVDFFRSGLLLDAEPQLTAAINSLTGFARSNDFPVVWVRQEYAADLSDAPIRMRDERRRVTIAGTDGCRLLPGLVTDPADHEIVKRRHSAFFGTELDSLLRSFAPTHLVLAGINSHACIRSTAIDAYARDFRLIFAADCIASYDAEFHRESMRYFGHALGEVRSNDAIAAEFGIGER